MQLYFPTFYEDHWFVFVVDIKDKKFVFLDSFYSQIHAYQQYVREKMVQFWFISFYLFFLYFWLILLLFCVKILCFRFQNFNFGGTSLLSVIWSSMNMVLYIQACPSILHIICMFLCLYVYTVSCSTTFLTCRHVAELLFLVLLTLIMFYPVVAL